MAALGRRVDAAGGAPVLLADQPDARVVVAQDDHGDLVGHPVVHHDELPVRAGLGRHRVDRGGQVLLGLVGRAEEAEQRLLVGHQDRPR